jgi:hypothetical protein
LQIAERGVESALTNALPPIIVNDAAAGFLPVISPIAVLRRLSSL